MSSSTTMMTTSSPALAALVSFLTRPLHLTTAYIATSHTIISLQLMLYSNLSPLFSPSNSTNNFTLTLSHTTLPITAISAACVVHNIIWSAWMAILSPSGSDLVISISPNQITVSGSGFTQTIWSTQPTHSEVVPSISKIRQGLGAAKSKLQMTLESAKARRSSVLLAESMGIQLPTLLCTPPTPVAVSIDVDMDSQSSSSDGSDSDDDSESGESTYSFASSHESFTSVESASSSPASVKSSLPSLFRSARPQIRTQRSQRGIPVDASQADVKKYLYQGGSTGVITGGVMLGASAAPLAPRVPSAAARSSASAPYRPAHMMQTRSTTKAARKVLLGPERDNWRV